MGTELGVAYLSILPETSKIAPGITRAMGSASKGADKSGKQVATRFGLGFNGAIGSIVSRSAGVFAAGFAAVQGAKVFSSFIADAKESAQVAKLTAQVIKSTGGAAKVSASQVGDLATAISNKTGMDDEAIQSGANLLLTFKNVRNEVGAGSAIFDRATSAAADLSAAGFGSMSSTSKQLGKALNDPLKGLTALNKSGVTFTEQQKKQIKTLVESGQTLQAQKIILGEVESQVGGAAAAIASPLDRLKTTAGNLSEEFGGILLPHVEKFATFLTTTAAPAVSGLFKRAQEFTSSKGFQSFLGDVGTKARDVFGFFKAEVLPRLKEFAGFVTGNVVPSVKNLITAFTPLAKDIGQAAVDVFQKLAPVLASIGTGIGTTVLPAIKDFTKFLKDNQTLVGAVAVGVGAMVTAFYAYKLALGVVSAATKAYAAIQAALNFVMALNPIGIVVLALVGLVAGLVYAYKNSETFRNVVNGAFNSVKSVVTTVISALITAFNAVVGAVTWVVNGVRSVWGTIVEAVSGPLNAIIGFLNAVWSRIYPIIALPVYIALSVIKGYLSLISTAFTAVKNWVVGAFAKAWSAVKGKLTGPVNDAKTALDTTWKNFKAAFTAVKDWAVGTFSKVWGAVKGVLTKPVNDAKTAIGTTLGAGKGGVQWVFSQAVSAIGKIWNGLQALAKAPIRFIVNTVLNDGLIGAFNWVAGKFGAPTIARIPLPSGFANGGQFDGRLPGSPSRTDNMLGMTAAGPVGLATGEYIVNARDTARNLPLLERINSGMGFADGGLFGKLKGAVGSAFSTGKSLGGDVLGFLKDPVKWFKDKMSGPLGRMSELGSSPMAEIVKAVPRNIVNTVTGKAKDLLTGLGGGGGPINPGLAGALSWARSQAGHPYLWGGVGPGGYDCSGFMSAIVNVIHGKNPYHRLFATGSMPAGLFDRGPGGFSVGWLTGSPGHTAGTLNGVNVESRGGQGVVVGSSARGASNGLFNSGVWHLKGYANGGLVGDPPFDLLDPRGKQYLGDDFAQQILPKALSFDNGGLLPTGYSVVHNGTGAPEPVGHDFLRKSDLDGMRIELDAGGVGTLTGHVRVAARAEISDSNRALKRRVMSGGGR